MNRYSKYNILINKTARSELRIRPGDKIWIIYQKNSTRDAAKQHMNTRSRSLSRQVTR